MRGGARAANLGAVPERPTNDSGRSARVSSNKVVVATAALAVSTAPAAYFVIGDQSSCCFAPGELDYWWRQPSWWHQSTIAAAGWAGIVVTAVSVATLISVYVDGQLRRREAVGIALLGAVGIVIAATYREATAGGIGALIGIQIVPFIGAAVVVGLLITAWRLILR